MMPRERASFSITSLKNDALRTTARNSLLRGLFAPVNIASLVFFRIVFGALMLAEATNWIFQVRAHYDFFQLPFHFTYPGFDWVRPWPGVGMYLHVLALGVLAVFVMLGLWYRVSMTLFFLGFTYVFLLDEALYHNHLYLICLFSFLMIFVPAHRALSLDAVRRPSIRANTAPAWALWTLRIQTGLVYFYSGLIKLLDSDWRHAEQFKIILATKAEGAPHALPIAGDLIGYLLQKEWMAYLFSYGGMLLDLSVFPLLLWRRTRVFAFALAVAFHLTNWQMFGLDLFPALMIAATTLFFSPSWPRRLLSRLRWPRLSDRLQLAERTGTPGSQNLEPAATDRLQPKQAATVVLFTLFVAFEVLVPLRHLLYPGNVLWTREGERFSWMMYMHAWAEPSSAKFSVTDPVSNRTWDVDPEEYLHAVQYAEMSKNPDMVLQFAHHIADVWHQRGYDQVEVYAEVRVPLNGREPQLLVDPTVDLAAQPRTLKPAEWIMPLKERRKDEAEG